MFWRLLEGTPAYVILLNRCLWSFPFLLIVTSAVRQYRKDLVRVKASMLPWIFISSILIALNWWIYIVGVNAHMVLEVSLGYFFSPLLTASLGVFFLKERLRVWQWIGIALVILGVALYSVSFGKIPVIAVGLALTFSLYSLVRKISQAPAMAAITIEAGFVFAIALGYVGFASADPSLRQAWDEHKTLLVLAGTLTAIPLLWFSIAVRGLSLTTLGLLNYISPTGKFLIAIFVFQESFSPTVGLAFGAIWIGIFVYLSGGAFAKPKAR